jgi:hypothetical protein
MAKSIRVIGLKFLLQLLRFARPPVGGGWRRSRRPLTLRGR